MSVRFLPPTQRLRDEIENGEMRRKPAYCALILDYALDYIEELETNMERLRQYADQRVNDAHKADSRAKELKARNAILEAENGGARKPPTAFSLNVSKEALK